MDYEQFIQEFEGLTGIRLNLYKENQMHRRINTLIERKKLSGFYDFIELLKKNPAELEAFKHYITINVTEFFRTPEEWKVFEADALKPLTDNRTEPLKAWSCASSMGQEPYSLAMSLAKLTDLKNFKVLGTDIDTEVLEKARIGFYPEVSIETLPEEEKLEFFTKENNGYQINEEIRSTVEFRQLDLLKDGYTTVDGIFYQVATEAEAVKSRTLKEEYAYDSASDTYYWTVQTYDASKVSGNDNYINVDGCYYVKCSKEEATEEVIPNDGYGIYTNGDTTVYYNANCASLTDACESYTLADGFNIVNDKVYRTATESDAMALEVKSGYMYDEYYDCYCKSADRSEAAQFNILDGYAVTEDGTYYCIYGEPVRFTDALENATYHNTENETLKDGYVKIGYNYYKTVTEATATTSTGELNEGYAKEGDIYYAATAVDESTATTTSLKDGYATTENGYRETAECDSDDALEAYLKDGYVSYDNCTYKVAGDGDTGIGSYNAELENWNNSEPNQATYLAGTSYASDLADYLASEPIKDNYKVGYATEEAATEAFYADKADWEESKPSEDTYIDSTSYQSDHDTWKALEPTE